MNKILDDADPEFANMFDLAPVSLWLEDFSEVKQLFALWRADGITDLRTWLRADTGRIEECSKLIRVLRVNKRTLELFGADDREHLIANLGQVFRDSMFDQHVEELAQLWEGKPRFSSETVNYTLSGERLDILLNAQILPGHEDDWSRVLLSIEDVTARIRARKLLAASEQYALGLFEHSPVSLWVEDFSAIKRLIDEVRERGIVDFRTFTDVHPEFTERCMSEIRVLQVNQQTLTLFGAPDRDTLLKSLDKIFRDDMRAGFTEQLIELWQGKLFQHREVVNYALNGNKIHVLMQFSVLPGHEDLWDLVQVSLTDITARKQAEAYLEFLGKHDVLTKLRNRSFFADELNRLERKGPFPISIVVADLNGLKFANDELGHVGGDALLRRAAEVLSKSIDKPGCAARIGGDEFALLMPGMDADGADELMTRIHELAELNNQFYGKPVLSFALGSATCLKGDRLEAVVNHADQQMYAAKRQFYANSERDRRGR
ncbi:sensor domain-containing diguanylate cyclase [soil metagenome]